MNKIYWLENQIEDLYADIDGICATIEDRIERVGYDNSDEVLNEKIEQIKKYQDEYKKLTGKEYK